jgi:hypothetical protein
MEAETRFLNALNFDNVDNRSSSGFFCFRALWQERCLSGKNPIGHGCSIEFNLSGQMLRSVTWRLGVQRKLLKKELASSVRRAAVIARTGWNEKASCN